MRKLKRRKESCKRVLPTNIQSDLGDIILRCNGNLITRIYDLNFFKENERTVDLRILRKGHEMDVVVPTVSGEEGETDRFVLWAGALLHAPHRAVRQQAKTLHSLVYIS